MKVIEITESVKMLGFQLSNERAVSEWNSSWMEWTDLIYVWSDLNLCQDQMFLLLIVAWAGGA